MQIKILLLGSFALMQWIYIWRKASRGPLGWTSPTCLFAFGLLLFYIIPPIYWQFRPWEYRYPPYFEGLPLVLFGAVILGIPFLLSLPKKSKRKKYTQRIFRFPLEKFGSKIWICVIPILLGIMYRLYMFSLGYQSRLQQEAVTLLGSEELGFLFRNITYIYPVFYFIMIALGNRSQRRLGKVFWVFDGIMQVFTLHRHAILTFVFRSLVFSHFLGWKMQKKHLIALSIFFIFVIGVIGKTNILAYDMVGFDKLYLTPREVLLIIKETTINTLSANGGNDESPFVSAIDDTMNRLYDARSASAVMINVPEVIPFFYGKTFMHLFYALIPRFFWYGKPSLREIHSVTKQVMPRDGGFNSTGTIAELYMNFGFLAVLLGGIVCSWICRLSEKGLLGKGYASLAWLFTYPLMSQWFLGVNYNFTQNLSELMRGLLIILFVMMLLKFARKTNHKVALEGK